MAIIEFDERLPSEDSPLNELEILATSETVTIYRPTRPAFDNVGRRDEIQFGIALLPWLRRTLDVIDGEE